MFNNPTIDALIDSSLAEDIGLGDLTTELLVPHDQLGSARVVAKQSAVLSGISVFQSVFNRLDPSVQVKFFVDEGQKIQDRLTVAELDGPLRSILIGERVALNYLQRLSGIATTTRQFVDALAPSSKTKIVDTRKTTPGLRDLERIAVRSGGGYNHRPRLDGGILIKDNHIAACGSIKEAIGRAKRSQGPALRIEVEVTNLEQVSEALGSGAEVIMLDNMDIDTIRRAITLIDRKAFVEVSGGITAQKVHDLSKLAVDFISVGALTHSAQAVDLSLVVETCSPDNK